MTTETTNPKETRTPTYLAYHVTEPTRRGQKGRWNRIRAYFQHVDGQGGTLILDSQPIAFNGRVVRRSQGRAGRGPMRTLLTADQRALMLANGQRSADGIDNSDCFPVVKLFTPDGACTWLLTATRPGGPRYCLRSL